MDIDLLAKMVKKLILDSDRVVLPGLGCFVAEVVPATFTDRGYTINPPYRKLYFRSKPDEGDELVTFYAQTNNMPLDVAESVVRDFLAEMKEVLLLKKIVVFPGLGRLRATKENDIFFVADEDLDIYPNGFGLEPISLKSHKESTEEVSAAVSELKSILDEPVQAPSPEPAPAPSPSPKPIAEPKPTAEPVPEPKPAPVSQPLQDTSAVPEPEPAPELTPMPALEPESAPEPAPVPEPAPTPEPAPEPAPILSDDPVEDELQPAEEPAGVWATIRMALSQAWQWLMDPKRRTVVLVIAGVVAVVILFFVIFAILAALFPSWMDGLLYSPEELEILNKIYE